jgi:hypothetical protein
VSPRPAVKDDDASPRPEAASEKKDAVSLYLDCFT